jgi:hypothetical protein
MKKIIRIHKHRNTSPAVPQVKTISAENTAPKPPDDNEPLILAVFGKGGTADGFCYLSDEELASLQRHAASKKIDMNSLCCEMVDRFLASVATVEKNLRPTGGAA